MIESKNRRDGSRRRLALPHHDRLDSLLVSMGTIAVRSVTSAPQFALLLALPILVCSLFVSQDTPAEPGLPPLARAKLRSTEEIIAHLAFHPNDGRLFSAGKLVGGIDVWVMDFGARELVPSVRLSESRISAMALSPDGRSLAAGVPGQGVAVWDTEGNSPPTQLAPESLQASALAFTPDGKALVAATWDGTVRVWDTATWTGRAFWSSPADGWNCLAVSPDGHTVVAGGRNGWLRSWDLKTGHPRGMLRVDGSQIRCVAYSPVNRTLAAGSYQGGIRMWDSTSFQELPSPCQPDLSSVVCMLFAPDGRQLATGHEDRVVRLWETKTGRLLRELRGHQHGLRSLAFRADGRTLASGGSDSTIFLWDPESEPTASRQAE